MDGHQFSRLLQHGHHLEGTGMNSRLKHIQNWTELAKESKWSVTKLARLCKVSVRTLQIYFEKQMDQSPKVWLVAQRQEQAAQLLIEGASVKEVAAKLGYKHAQHFSREFKKFWHFCPTQMGVEEHRLVMR
jgi:transcriptional regulator GlxA family with amidase domain